MTGIEIVAALRAAGELFGALLGAYERHKAAGEITPEQVAEVEARKNAAWARWTAAGPPPSPESLVQSPES